MNMKLEDEWIESTAMKDAFAEAMRKHDYPDGNEKTTIDYSKLEIGSEIVVKKGESK